MSLEQPRLFNKHFAQDADPKTLHTVPDEPNPNDIAQRPSLASYSTGFPPRSMAPPQAGGQPFYGQDVNGILKDLSANVQYMQAGNYYPFNADFQKAVGGYNKFAVVLNSEDGKLYQSLVDNNTAPLSDKKSWIFFTEGRYLPIDTPIFYIGEFRNFPFRGNKLPDGWYPRNGASYPLTSEIGKVLDSLDSDFKSDWGIKVTDGNINVPNAFDENGKGYFERPVDGNFRKIGSTQGDAIRNITGEFGGVSAEGVFIGAFSKYNWVGSKAGTTTSMYSVTFDASRVVPAADENRPKNIGMTPAIYLGV